MPILNATTTSSKPPVARNGILRSLNMVRLPARILQVDLFPTSTTVMTNGPCMLATILMDRTKVVMAKRRRRTATPASRLPAERLSVRSAVLGRPTSTVGPLISATTTQEEANTACAAEHEEEEKHAAEAAQYHGDSSGYVGPASYGAPPADPTMNTMYVPEEGQGSDVESEAESVNEAADDVHDAQEEVAEASSESDREEALEDLEEAQEEYHSEREDYQEEVAEED